MTQTLYFLLLISAVHQCIAYTEALSQSLAIGSSFTEDGSKKISFTPQVAFKCGFRNRYLTEDGIWKTDPDARASCLTGKLDVLKYCRKAYRKMTITNIVELSHYVEVDSWCKEEGSPCKWSFWVKPYRCVVGEFESETLLVPNGCHFDHVNRDNVCKDFDYWNQTAIGRCQRRGVGHSIHSFSMLEPCGIDMFSGVEFVCCPKKSAADKNSVHIDKIKVAVKPESEVHQESHVLQSPADFKTHHPLVSASIEDGTHKKTNLHGDKDDLFGRKSNIPDDEDDDDDDEDDEDDDNDNEDDDDDDDELLPTDSKSLYLRVADPKNEHEAYRNALQDLNKQHKNKVSKVMKEWSELEDRYIKMKSKDPAHAESFKAEMNSRFQKTVAALEEENAEERRQVEHVHQQRVVANLNEKKRHALMDFHQLYSWGSDPEASAVLHALKAYVRAEEKERLHLINHYRHLLRSRSSDALASEADLLGKVLEIDRRIGSTIDLLNSHHKIDAKVKSAILDFFKTYRRENTPDMPKSFPDGFLNADQYRELMEVYRRQVAPKAPVFDDGQSLGNQLKLTPRLPDHLGIEKAVAAFNKERDQEEDLAYEPMDSYSALNVKHSHSHDFAFKEKSLQTSATFGSGYVLLSVAGVCVVAAVICGTFIMRQRSSRAGQGFIEVNACTPEECHVANMQITGYENPAYKFFEERA